MSQKKKRRKKNRAEKISPTTGKGNRALPAFFSSRWWWILLLVLCTSYVLKLFFTGGHTYSMDGAIHTARVQMVYESFLDGEVPLWSNRYWEGFPLLQFYPPLFFYLTALLNLLVGNLLFSIKLMAFAGQVLSGITVFLLVKEVTDDNQAGFIGGLGFALAPWHVFHILDFCRHTVIFTYALLPLPFLFYEKYRNRKLTFVQAGILAGLSLSVLLAFQYGYAVFITLIFILHIISNSISYKKPFFNLQSFWVLLVAGLVCVGTSLAFIGPFILERELASPGYILSLNRFNVDSATFSGLFTRQALPDLHKGYIGVSLLVLSLIGVFSALREKKYPLLVLYAFCFYIVLGHETALYKYIPLIYAQQATARLILYLMLFMSILAGVGIKLLKSYISPRFNGKAWPVVFVLIAVICFWDMAVTKDRHWQSSYPMSRVYKNFAKSVAEYKLRHARTIRTMQICSHPGLNWMFDQVFPATLSIESPTSGVGMKFVHKKIPYSLQGKNWVQQELEYSGGGNLSASQGLLYLMNVYTVFYIDAESRVRIINNPSTTYAVGSGSLGWHEDFSRYPQDGETGMIKPLIKRMSLNQERNNARQLFLMQKKQLPDRPFTEDSRLDILNFEQTINKSFLEVETTHDCYLQLSHTYYPYLHVLVDNEQVPFYETVFGTIALSLPMGRHHIRIEPYLSPTRKVCYILNLVFLLLAIVFYRRFKLPPEEERM